MADFSNGFIGLSYGIQSLGQLGTAYEQSQALQAQGNFQRTMAEINQQFANRQADQVVAQGNRQADQIHRSGLQVQGAQRAAAAAQNIRTDDGSAGDAVDTTRYMSADDQITARANAWREAFGLRTQAQMNVTQAKFQQRANNNAAQATLLGGALSSFGSGMKAVGFGLKAYKDMQTPERTDTQINTRTASDADNEYFNQIFPNPDQVTT